jgi:hypothetical protein
MVGKSYDKIILSCLIIRSIIVRGASTLGGWMIDG